MNTTMDLFGAALQKQNASKWAKELGLDRAALSVAKKTGRLAPDVAGYIAMKLGADVQQWITVAVLETKADSVAVAELKRNVNRWRKL